MKSQKSKLNAKVKEVTELRQDAVTKRWVLISTRRGKRPQEYRVKEKPPVTPIAECPFETPKAGGNAPAVLVFDAKGNNTSEEGSKWRVRVIPNKYPVLIDHDGVCAEEVTKGLEVSLAGIGKHEVIITKDHRKDLGDLPVRDVALVVRAWRDRMRDIARDACIQYVLVFQNHGKDAGASVQHPHSQLIALPIVPPDVARSLEGSLAYFDSNKCCVHCDILSSERKARVRVVGETKDFIVLTPYAPHAPFELRIFPKKHQSDFRLLDERGVTAFAEILKQALHGISHTLGEYSYNMFVHTAPVGKGDHSHYHWHVEVLPKSSTHAGLEFGTGILALSITPESAAEMFRKKWK